MVEVKSMVERVDHSKSEEGGVIVAAMRMSLITCVKRILYVSRTSLC